MKPMKNRNGVANKEEICKKWFLKTHLLKDRICSMKRRVDDCSEKITYCCIWKAHIKQLVTLWICKISQSQISSSSISTNTIAANTRLDSASDTTLITSECQSVRVCVCVFFNCCLATPRSTLWHCQGGSLTNLMLISTFEGYLTQRSLGISKC